MRRRASVGDTDGLAAKLQALCALNYHDLQQRFLALYGAQPPPRIGRALLLRAIAYRVQNPRADIDGIPPVVGT